MMVADCESEGSEGELIRSARLKQLLCCILAAIMIAGTLPGFGIGNRSASASAAYTLTYDGNGNDGGKVHVDYTSYKPGDLVIVHDNSNGLRKDGFIFGGWNTAANGTGIDYLPGQTLLMGSQNITLYAKWIDPKTSWSDRSSIASNLNDVVYSNGAFYAVGKSGTIVSSLDGTIWTKQTSMTTKDLYAITSGNDKLVAVGANGTIVISDNGEDWSNRPSATSSTLRGVTYGNGMYLAVGDGGTIVVSKNGSAWAPVASGTTNHLYDVIYAKGKFIVVGGLGTIITSTDGYEWSPQTSNAIFDFYGVTEGNGKIVAVGLLGTVAISDDGVTWTSRMSVVFSPLNDITYGNGLFIAVGEAPWEINYSTDGVTWTTSSNNNYKWTGVAYGNGLFVIVGDSGILTSANGTNWTKYQHPDLYGIAHGNGIFVAAGASGGIYSSENGAKWKKQTSNTPNDLRSITYGSGLFVAVGNAGTIVTSSNGVNWTNQASPTSNRLNGVTYGNGLFVAVGESGTVVYSANGSDWTLADTGFADVNLQAVAYGLGKFVAVGPDGGNSLIYSSDDGKTWGSIIVDGVKLFSIAGNDTQFVAAGLNTDGDPTQNVYTAVYDYVYGVNWERISSGTSQKINGVAYANETFVLVGDGGVVRTSDNGTGYMSVTTGISAALQAVAGEDGTFVAVGQSGAMVQSRKEAPVKYTIHFDANGGDTKANPAFMMLMSGESIGALPAPPSRPGYTFAGWNTEPDGSGTVLDESYVMEADMVAYAQWLTLPSAPTNLTGTARVSEVVLEWDAVTGAESYAVYQYEGEEAPEKSSDWILVEDNIPATSYTVTGLTDGKTYAFAVKAANVLGTSDYSEVTIATPGGKGTLEEPYVITTAQRLNEVREKLDAYYVLANDIDLSGYGDWTPIGWPTPFTGHFDGKGYRISGLKVRGYSISNDGLFGTIGHGGKVQNLVLSDVDLSSTNLSSSIGALAGKLEGEAVNIRVSGGTVAGQSNVGGLVGETSNGAVITASHASVQVTGNGFYAGGLVGYLADASVNASCSTGEVSGNSYVGGLAGYIVDSEITDSYATGSVFGYFSVGGLIGGVSYDLDTRMPTSTVKRVFAAGKVENPSSASVGGLIGENTAPITLSSVYYDKEKTGQADEEEFSGLPLTHDEMGKEDSFSGWDFDTIWHLDDRIGAPTFLWDDNMAPVMNRAKILNEAPDEVVVSFSEKVEADDEALERFTASVNGSEVQIDGAQLNEKELILTLRKPVKVGQEVTITFTDGEPTDKAVTDKAQNQMAPQTIQADNEVESTLKIVSVTPADNETGVALDEKLILTFNESVEAMPGKYIYLMDEGDTIVEKIEANAPNVQIEEHVVTITPSANLLPLRGYYVLIDAGAFRLDADDVHGGIWDKAAWNFMTAPDPTIEWLSIGQGFTEGKAISPVLKVGTDGTLYVLFGDKAHGGKATVMKLAKTDAQWSLVGSAGFSPGAIGAPSLLADGDVLYAAFGVVDQDNLAFVHVMKYELDGEGDWTPAANPIEVGEYVPGYLVYQDSAPFLLKHESAIYVAYRNGTVIGAMTVKKLGADGNWETIGNADFSAGDIYDPSLAVLDGTLYAGFTDYTFEAGYGATVMKFDTVSGSWELVGSRGFTSDIAFDTSLVTDGKRLYVVCEIDDHAAHKASAMFFDFDQGEWVKADNGFSVDQAFGIDAAAENGGLYAAFQDAGLGDRVAVMKYAGNGWVAVGTLGVTPGKAYNPSIIVHDGIVYIAFEDGSSSGKLSVMKYSTFNRPPKAVNVKIEGTQRAGETVSGKYDFIDEENDEEGASLYQWYVADNQSGDNRKIITGATKTTLKLTKDHVGKYLIFEVTPVAAHGTLQGASVSSAPTGPVVPSEAPDAPNVSADDVLNVIIGADATMEYSTDGGKTYIPYDPSNPPKFPGNVTVKVRVAANEATGAPAGADKTLIFTDNTPESTDETDEPTDSTISQPTTDPIVTVLINGKEENVGKSSISTENEQTIMTITLDPVKLNEKLAVEGQNAIVTIPIPSGYDVAVGELNGEMVKNLEDNQAILEIKTDRATYTVPAQQINIAAISEQIGTSVALQDIKIQIEIGEPKEDTVKLVENVADGTFEIVAAPIEFTIRATYAGTTIEISKFSTYVERTIAISDDVDPSKITTGVVVEPDGTVRHVPTKITVIDGKYYAVLNSLTNSIYTVVWHPVEFSDMVNHWAMSAVNDMGSRMVVEGTGNGWFSPDKNITRAEFAAILVRGLGLDLESGETAFSDVKVADWYSGAIRAAHEYGLISGYDDGTFGPNDFITREQAMTIIAKAMNLTGLKNRLNTQAAEITLHSFEDEKEIASWARNGVADVLQAGIVVGRSTNVLAPKGYVTRAEVAVMTQRLLELSELI